MPTEIIGKLELLALSTLALNAVFGNASDDVVQFDRISPFHSLYECLECIIIMVDSWANQEDQCLTQLSFNLDDFADPRKVFLNLLAIAAAIFLCCVRNAFLTQICGLLFLATWISSKIETSRRPVAEIINRHTRYTILTFFALAHSLACLTSIRNPLLVCACALLGVLLAGIWSKFESATPPQPLSHGIMDAFGELALTIMYFSFLTTWWLLAVSPGAIRIINRNDDNWLLFQAGSIPFGDIALVCFLSMRVPRESFLVTRIVHTATWVVLAGFYYIWIDPVMYCDMDVPTARVPFMEDSCRG